MTDGVATPPAIESAVRASTISTTTTTTTTTTKPSRLIGGFMLGLVTALLVALSASTASAQQPRTMLEAIENAPGLRAFGTEGGVETGVVMGEVGTREERRPAPSTRKGTRVAAVPDRQLPPPVLAGVRLMEHEFEKALARDCAPERCFAKGCNYVSHAVVDRPATRSLPGLGLDPGPGGGGDEQIYLTDIECGFAHEPSVKAKDARALAKRLAKKLSTGWTTVDVSYESLDPLPDFLRDPPEDPPEEPPPPPEPAPEPEADAGVGPTPETWDGAVAGRELWLSVLPHFPWMIGLFLVTLAALLMVWAARRLGRISPEEQALLASLAVEGAGEDAPDPDAPAEAEPAGDADEERISARLQAWRARLAADDVEADRILAVLATDLLRTGERRMLAKAVILFPDAFPRVFPQGGDFAAAKFELAEYLKHADPDALPSDGQFFDTLDRYAMSAALTSHSDTELIRSLHDDFGPAALVDAVGRLPARHGALLFAMAPQAMQHEAVRRLDGRVLAALTDQLMRSNRMDPTENAYLLDVLERLGKGEAMPAPPPHGAVSDRGAAFDAAGTLSIMLPHVNPETRQALVQAALSHHAGHLPDWMQDTLYGEMLLRVGDEARSDLMLAIDPDALAAWLAVQTEAAGKAIESRMPNALRAAVGGAPKLRGAALYARANEGRAALSAGVQRWMDRSGTPFEQLLV